MKSRQRIFTRNACAHRNHERPDPADIHAAVWPVGCCADVLPGGDIHEQQDEKSSGSVILATWDDVPHLDERAKEMLFASYIPFPAGCAQKEFLLSAVAQSIRYQSRILSFLILRCPITGRVLMAWMSDGTGQRQFGGAFDRETSTSYLYSAALPGEAEPVVHAGAVKSRGKWIPSAIDPGVAR